MSENYQTTQRIDPNILLEDAKDELREVLIIGEQLDGFPYYESSTSDGNAVLIMLDKFREKLIAGEFDTWA